MEKHTFGNTPAAEILVVILDEINDKKITAKVSKFLNNYFLLSNSLEYAYFHASLIKLAYTEFIAQKREFRKLLYNETNKRALFLDTRIVTFVLNLIAADNRKKLNLKKTS